MGKQIYLKRIKELFEKSPVVDLNSIKKLVGPKNTNYAKLLVHNLLKKGYLKRLARGFYTIYNESSLAVFAFKPSYIGLQSALSHWQVWEQETIPIIITQKKVRRGIKNILDSNIMIRHINKKYFFGDILEKEGKFYIPYSDLEKTFIDMIVFNQYMDENLIKKIIKQIDKKKLKKYLKKYPAIIVKRVNKKITLFNK